MIESILIWAIASVIFAKFGGYPLEGCMSGFFIMAGFGLVIESRRQTLKKIAKGLNAAAGSLTGIAEKFKKSESEKESK